MAQGQSGLKSRSTVARTLQCEVLNWATFIRSPGVHRPHAPTIPEQRAARPGLHSRGPPRPVPGRGPPSQEPRLLARLPGLGPALRPHRPQPHPSPHPGVRSRPEPHPGAHGAAARSAGGPLPPAARPRLHAGGPGPLPPPSRRGQRSHPADRRSLVQRGRGAHALVLAGARHRAALVPRRQEPRPGPRAGSRGRGAGAAAPRGTGALAAHGGGASPGAGARHGQRVHHVRGDPGRRRSPLARVLRRGGGRGPGRGRHGRPRDLRHRGLWRRRAAPHRGARARRPRQGPGGPDRLGLPGPRGGRRRARGAGALHEVPEDLRLPRAHQGRLSVPLPVPRPARALRRGVAFPLSRPSHHPSRAARGGGRGADRRGGARGAGGLPRGQRRVHGPHRLLQPHVRAAGPQRGRGRARTQRPPAQEPGARRASSAHGDGARVGGHGRARGRSRGHDHRDQRGRLPAARPARRGRGPTRARRPDRAGARGGARARRAAAQRTRDPSGARGARPGHGAATGTLRPRWCRCPELPGFAPAPWWCSTT